MSEPQDDLDAALAALANLDDLRKSSAVPGASITRQSDATATIAALESAVRSIAEYLRDERTAQDNREWEASER